MTQLSRRALLGVAVAASLAACTSEPEPAPPPDPDDLLREAAVARERALLREYEAVLLVLPTLAARLTLLRAEHAAHLGALLGGPGEQQPSAAGPATSAPGAPAVPPPATAAAALKGLAQAERTAAAAHAQAALDASRPLAAVLASLAASEASHPVVLG